MSILKLSQLSVSYESNQVINDLDLSIREGEIMALFGPSGCGKSTILKAVAGLLEQVSGSIELANTPILNDTVNVATEHRHIGLIFQDYALFPHLTLAQNIAFGLDKLSKEAQQAKVDKMLKLIKMSHYADKFPHEISGGQQQRVAIVRALACEPKILLFDEAFSNIDPQFRFELIADIRHLLKEQNTAALFVTHNQDEAFAFCDRIAVLNQGKIEQVDEADILFNQPATRFVAEFLGDGIWLSTQVQSAFKLSSELGEIIYSGDQNLEGRVGQNVSVYLRPHQLKLVNNDTSDIVVEYERFVGEFYESTIQWHGQTIKVKTKHSYLNQSIDLKVDTHIAAVFN